MICQDTKGYMLKIIIWFIDLVCSNKSLEIRSAQDKTIIKERKVIQTDFRTKTGQVIIYRKIV